MVLEEFGSPDLLNHTKIQLPWLEAVLKSGVAADQVWQFGPVNISVDPHRSLYGDEWSVYYGAQDWRVLGRDHARAMMAKPAPALVAAR